MDESVVTCPECGEPVETAVTMFCPECGELVEEELDA